MNRSFNLVLGISLCLAIVGGLWVMSSLNKEDGLWRPSDIYSQLGSSYSGTSTFTNATLGSSSSSNDGVHVSLRGGSLSSRAHAPHYSYAPVSGGAMGSVSLSGGRSSVAAGQGLYTTSSAELRSFGGGNASAGSSGGFRSNGQGAIAQASGISSPLSVNSVSYTPVLHTSSSSSAGGEEMLAVAQASNVASVSSYAGMGYTTATYGTASYGATAPRGISGRRGTGEDMTGTYSNWLSWFDKVGYTYGTSGENGNYTFDWQQAENAYNAWVSTLPPNLPVPSLSMWLEWLMGNGGSHTSEKTGNTYSFVPVGDISVLWILGLIYFLVLILKRRRETSKIELN